MQRTNSGLGQITRLLQGQAYQHVNTDNINAYFIFAANTTSTLLRSGSQLLKKKEFHNRKKGIEPQMGIYC
jgi:hypothetical protein